MARIGVGVVLWMVGTVCFAVPYTVEITPTADAFVRSLVPGANYGAAGALAVSGSSALNGAGQQMGILDTFMKFNVAGVVAQMDAQFGAGNWEFTDAVLRLTEDPAPQNPILNWGVGQFEIRWIASDAWLEGTGQPLYVPPRTDGVCYADEATFLNPAVDAALGLFSNTLTAGDHLYALDLAGPFVDDLMDAGDVSFFLTASDESVGFTFYSRSVSGGRPFPTLYLTADVAAQAVPEPATATLLLVGMLGAFGRLRRRRRAP